MGAGESRTSPIGWSSFLTSVLSEFFSHKSYSMASMNRDVSERAVKLGTPDICLAQVPRFY